MDLSQPLILLLVLYIWSQKLILSPTWPSARAFLAERRTLADLQLVRWTLSKSAEAAGSLRTDV